MVVVELFGVTPSIADQLDVPTGVCPALMDRRDLACYKDEVPVSTGLRINPRVQPVSAVVARQENSVVR